MPHDDQPEGSFKQTLAFGLACLIVWGAVVLLLNEVL